MDDLEEGQFRVIAMGELSRNREWQHLSQDLAELTMKAFSMLKGYGIESFNGMVFVCEADVPVFTIESMPHMREHLL